MENKKYLGNEMEKSFADEKQLALEELTPFLENLPDEMLDKPYMSIGSDVFSLRRIISEIETSTDNGRFFVQMLTEHRLEFAQRKEEFDDNRESQNH